ncbi:hypothetical protein [Anaeromyxobacter sp. SG66]|uniref:hypothetical protein n=1 Tax=Anaeromyxobacter sp. SG66 TaxID=2925410 RepID=UPI001F583CF4|nr:hypothetical protein [Anaeromyxobacter sp. SG66]
MSNSLDLSFLRARPVQKRIVAVTVAFAIVGVGYALLAPKWFRSTVTLVPAKQQKGGISSLLGAEVAGLAAGFEAGGGTDAPRIAAVLQGTAVTDAVIEKFDLRARYGEKYQENARAELWRHCDVRTLPKPNLVELSCEDTDPRFVQTMLAYFADYGNQVFRRVGVSSASEEVRFLEKRVAELRQAADETAARMRVFQEKYQIVDIDTQTKAVVSALANLHGQRINKELELEYARTFSARDEATLQQLRSQIAVVDDKLRDLEQPSPERDEQPQKQGRRGKQSGSVFPAALAVPKLRAEFETLVRDRKVSEATLVFALERLEGAKANEARDVSTFQVLDPPTVPTKKTRPQGLFVLMQSILLGLAASVGWQWWRAGGLAQVFRTTAGSSPRSSAADGGEKSR